MFDLRRIEDLDIEVIDGDRGKNYPHKEELFDSGYCLFLSASNVTKQGFKFDENVYISRDKDDILRSGKMQRGDIVITTRGTVGNVAYYSENIPYDQIRINSGMLIVRCGDELNPHYIYYILSSIWFFQQILQIQTGSAQPQLPKSHFLKMEIPVPTKEVQDKIVEILRPIDEKIEDNDEINKNLEDQVDSLFSELFVQNANSLWPVGTISDLGKVVGGSTPSKKIDAYYTDHGIVWITPKDLSQDHSKFFSHGEIDITELGLSNSSAVMMPAGTVLFSSRAPIGYIAIAANELCTNQGFKSVVPKKEIGTAFVYCFLKFNLPVIESMASGSTFKEVSGSTMKAIPAIIPDLETISRFNDFAAPLLSEQQNLEAENRRLSQIRDSLLPKLMSGELDVSDIDT